MPHLAALGAPSLASSNKECDMLHGLTAAVEALCQCSDIQHEKRTSLTENASKVVNRGRIICITNLKR